MFNRAKSRAISRKTENWPSKDCRILRSRNTKYVCNWEWLGVNKISLGSSLASSLAPGYPSHPPPPLVSSEEMKQKVAGLWLGTMHSVEKPQALFSPLRTLAAGPWTSGRKLKTPPGKPAKEEKPPNKAAALQGDLQWPALPTAP